MYQPDPKNPAGYELPFHMDEFVGGLPIGLGFRVPMIVISPLSVRRPDPAHPAAGRPTAHPVRNP